MITSEDVTTERVGNTLTRTVERRDSWYTWQELLGEYVEDGEVRQCVANSGMFDTPEDAHAARAQWRANGAPDAANLQLVFIRESVTEVRTRTESPA
jgi:hypothetical protein